MTLKDLLGNVLNGPVDRAVADAAPVLGQLADAAETRFREIVREELDRFNGAKLKFVDGGLQLELTPVAPPAAGPTESRPTNK